MIIIGDGDWDDETGRDRRSKHDVLKQAHQTYDYIFTIVCKFFFVDLGAWLKLILAPSQNFEYKKEGNLKLRTILEEQVSKPAHEGFYLGRLSDWFLRSIQFRQNSQLQSYSRVPRRTLIFWPSRVICPPWRYIILYKSYYIIYFISIALKTTVSHKENQIPRRNANSQRVHIL